MPPRQGAKIVSVPAHSQEGSEAHPWVKRRPRSCPQRVHDGIGGTLVGTSEGAPTWMRNAISAPSVSERVLRCDAGIGETPRLRLGL